MHRTNKLIAIDQGSRKCGYAVLEAGQVIMSGVLKPKGKDRIVRYKQLLNDLTELICDNPCGEMAIEDVFLKRSGFSNPKTSKIMGETRGVIMSVGLMYDMDIVSINPSDLTKFLKVNTRTTDKKKAAQEYVKALLNKEVEEDEADAVLIALIAYNRNIHEQEGENVRRRGKTDLRRKEQKYRKQERKTS